MSSLNKKISVVGLAAVTILALRRKLSPLSRLSKLLEATLRLLSAEQKMWRS